MIRTLPMKPTLKIQPLALAMLTATLVLAGCKDASSPAGKLPADEVSTALDAGAKVDKPDPLLVSVPADFGGDSNTLIIHNEDTPGCIAEVTTCLAVRRINVASMQVFRAGTGGYAVMVLECDSHIPHPLERKLATLPGILKVTCLNIDEPEEDAEE